MQNERCVDAVFSILLKKIEHTKGNRVHRVKVRFCWRWCLIWKTPLNINRVLYVLQPYDMQYKPWSAKTFTAEYSETWRQKISQNRFLRHISFKIYNVFGHKNRFKTRRGKNTRKYFNTYKKLQLTINSKWNCDTRVKFLVSHPYSIKKLDAKKRFGNLK